MLDDLAKTLANPWWQASMFGAIVLTLFGAYSFWHQRGERMSRTQRRLRRQFVRSEISDLITNPLEEAVKKGELERSDVDRFYKDMKKIGYKDLGHEPSFGKPWYTTAKTNLRRTKTMVVQRLGGMHAAYTKLSAWKQKETKPKGKQRLEALIVRK